jgi:hypothetical protein
MGLRRLKAEELEGDLCAPVDRAPAVGVPELDAPVVRALAEEAEPGPERVHRRARLQLRTAAPRLRSGAIPCPYPHTSVDVDEVIFYQRGVEDAGYEGSFVAG